MHVVVFGWGSLQKEFEQVSRVGLGGGRGGNVRVIGGVGCGGGRGGGAWGEVRMGGGRGGGEENGPGVVRGGGVGVEPGGRIETCRESLCTAAGGDGRSAGDDVWDLVADV